MANLVELEKDLTTALTQTRSRKVLSEIPLWTMTNTKLQRTMDGCSKRRDCVFISSLGKKISGLQRLINRQVCNYLGMWASHPSI